MKRLKLAPSLFAANFANLTQDILLLEAGGAEYLHIDVMDGHFVPNLSLGPQLVKSIRSISKLFFDVHLMVSKPEYFIREFIDSGADSITIHIEAEDNIENCIAAANKYSAKVCLSIKPQTPVEAVKPYLHLLDMVLVMSVEPGFGGQKFLETTIEKIQKLKELIDQINPACNIEVDGGVNIDNMPGIINAGANIIVVGSSLFDTDNLCENVIKFKKLM